MYGKVSQKKQLVLGIILLGIILGVTEAFANVWWYELKSCPFETNEIYSHLHDDAKKSLCTENFNLQFLKDKVVKTSGVTVQINNEGFRGSEFSTEKSSGTYRIIAVGGSTTFGVGVFDYQTFPYFLQEKFNDADFDACENILSL